MDARRGLAILAALSIGTAGCGGDDGNGDDAQGGGDDFIAALNSACADSQEAFEAGAAEAGFEQGEPPQSQEEALELTQVQLEAGEALQQGISDLEAPEELQETFDEYVGAREEVISAREEALAAAEEDREEDWGAAQQRADSAAIDAERIAADLGATECAQGPSGSSPAAQEFDEAQRDFTQALNEAGARIDETLAGDDLAAIQADAAAVRNAVFEFDSRLREIEFPSEVQQEVNTVLSAAGEAIATLDAVAEASDVSEARELVERNFDEVGELNEASSQLSAALNE